MTDDAELLRRYAGEKSEAAFAELVRRHIDFVYGAALRQARGNAALAQEVTQTVFTDFARKATALARHEVVVGWLHTATRFAAAKAIRAESRWQARAQEAHAMSEALHEANASADWARLHPVLDAVLGELKERERAAILLRFYEQKPLAEVGAALALSETAARSCVDRALEKLHAQLARRGVTSTTAALALALGHPGVAAPAGLAASVTGAALAVVGAGGATVAITFMSITKATLAALAVAAGVAVIWQQQRANLELRAELEKLRPSTPLQAAGSHPAAETKLSAAAIALPRPVAMPTAPRAAVAPGPDGAPPAASPTRRVTDFVNAGRATPRATLETNYWAKTHLDLATLASSFEFDDAGKLRADIGFALLSEDMQRQFGTPEHLAAAMMADRPGPSAIAILDEMARGPDDADLKIRGVNPDGTAAEETLHYHRGADGWRVVIPATAVDGAVNLIIKDPNTIPRPAPKPPEKDPGAIRG